MQNGQQAPLLDNPTQIYKIVSLQDPHFCLDCAYDAETQGKLVLFTQNDGLYQKWRVMSDLQGNVGFMSLLNAGVLKMPADGKKGSQCIVSAPTGGMNQKWKIVPSGKGFAILSALHPQLCLDICEEKTVNNNKIIVWQMKKNKLNQQWVFVPL